MWLARSAVRPERCVAISDDMRRVDWLRLANGEATLQDARG
jgi:hypothetical protein